MKLRIASLLLMPGLLAACGGDPTRPGGNGEPPPLKAIEKTSALAAANANVRSILTGSAQSAMFAGDSQLIGDVADMTGGCNSASPEPAPGDPPPPDTGCTDLTFDDSATSMSDRVADKILNIANIESEEETKLVLKLIPERICESNASIDQLCVDAFNANPIRLEITSRVENDIDVGILIGEARTNPVDLTLHRSELAIEIDLGAAKSAAQNLMAALGESGDIPSTLSGRVRFSIKKNAENNYTLAFAILSAIDVAIVDGTERIAVHIGAANPAISVNVDGNQNKLTMALGFGEISGELPLSSMFSAEAAPCTIDMNGNTICDPPPPPVTGTVGYRLGAYKMSTTLNGNAMETAQIDGIDFGSGFAMTIDNKPLVSADADLRTLKLSSTEQGMRVSVLPSLIANVSLDFRNIADRVMDVPPYLADDDITLELKGAAEPAIMFNNMTESVEVLAGSLMIRSRAAGRSVDVAAGMCVIVEEPVEGTDPHPVELLSGGTCP